MCRFSSLQVSRAIVVQTSCPKAEHRIDLGYEGPDPSLRTMRSGALSAARYSSKPDNASPTRRPAGRWTVRIVRSSPASIQLIVEDNGLAFPLKSATRCSQPFYWSLGAHVDGSTAWVWRSSRGSRTSTSASSPWKRTHPGLDRPGARFLDVPLSHRMISCTCLLPKRLKAHEPAAIAACCDLSGPLSWPHPASRRHAHPPQG